MKNYKSKNALILLLSLILALSFLIIDTASLYAVDFSQATREVDRMSNKEREIEKKVTAIPKKPEIEEAAPKKEEPKEAKFFVKKINLVGTESFPPEEFAPIIKKYEEKEVTMSELNLLSQALQREYLKRGVITAVFIPQQEVKDNVLIMRVIEARMGQVIIKEHSYFDNDILKDYWSIEKREILRYDKISKSVQMMNKNPDREVKAALTAGKEPGTTDIFLTAKTTCPIHASFTIDNEGSLSTGRWRYGFGARHNNMLNHDDILLTGYTFGKDFNGIYAYHNLPISASGASLFYGYSKSKSRPKMDFLPFNMNATSEDISMSIRQDVYKKDEYLGDVHIGFDAKDKTTKYTNGTLNRDRLRILRLGGTIIKRGLGSTSYILPRFSQGMQGFGASKYKNNPLASNKAESIFSKFNLDYQNRTALPFKLQHSLKCNLQLASQRLTPQEEFNLGGMDSVRGYPYSWSVDNAFLTNYEILVPPFFIQPSYMKLPYADKPLKEQVAGVLFFDYGWGQKRGEEDVHNLTSLGCGLRINFYNQAVVRLEWGFPIGDPAPNEDGPSRFHFSVDVQDKLPEEIERITKEMRADYIKALARDLINNELAKPGSTVRNKLHGYIYMAGEHQRQGRLKDAKEIYEKLKESANSLYTQAEEYVREQFNRYDGLKETNRLAKRLFKDGSLKEAKELSLKVLNEAKVKPLILKF